jgi:hypothetical protein
MKSVTEKDINRTARNMEILALGAYAKNQLPRLNVMSFTFAEKAVDASIVTGRKKILLLKEHQQYHMSYESGVVDAKTGKLR